MGKSESLKHWTWEYKKNPINRMEILVALKDNKIIGHYAVNPMKMKIGNKFYLVALSLDTMTHNNFRGRNIFPKLASNLYNELGKTGIPITYGFPNSMSINGFIKKLNWFNISEVPIYIRPLNFRSIVYKFINKKYLSIILGFFLNYLYNISFKTKKISKTIKIEKLNTFSEDFDNLWEKVKSEISIGLVRNKIYLNWRYFQKPEENYQVFALKQNEHLRGYIVLKIEARFGLKIVLIMDVLTDPSNLLYQNSLIKFAIHYFNKKKADIISIVMFSHSRYYYSLRKFRFIKTPKRFFPEEIHFGCRLNNKDIAKNFIKDSKNWYITWGDTDVV